MQEYDAILKRVLMRFAPAAALRLTGFEAGRWLNVELAEVRRLRVDLLGETTAGKLFHIELQSANDPGMARRMLEYAVAIYGQYGRRPEQLVLYTGEAPLRMNRSVAEFGFHCRMLDIRECDPEPLLASESLAENVITVLMKHRDRRAGVRRLLERIGRADAGERATALTEIFILAGLRKLAPLIREEAAKMPILDDIMDHEVLGPKMREARAEGEREGERRMLMRLFEKRFGPLPQWAGKRLDSLSVAETEEIALRLLDVRSLEELLAP